MRCLVNFNSLGKLSPVFQSVGFASEVLEEKELNVLFKFNKDTLQGALGFHEGECRYKNLIATKKSNC